MAGRGVDIKLGGISATPEEQEEIKKLGGLFVLGTERHDARRIDNQLRGRSGRQGDIGETQFFVSMEDTLMRVFASDTVKNMMGRLGIPEDQAIENKMITKSLESAQTKIEGFNFDSRKHTLQFDDVLNHQRKTIYERRRKAITGEKEDVADVLNNIIKELKNPDHQYTEEFSTLLNNLDKAKEEKIKALGEEEFYNVIRRIILQTTDMLWVEHLEVMDYLRSTVNLRAYGQRDPLVEYKKEGLRLFKEMQEVINEKVISLIPNIGEGAFIREKRNLQAIHKQAKSISGSNGDDSVPAIPITNSDKIGRNDLCSCGSGKKSKKCCKKN
jgi:preprotein translocase subunit SecA